MDSAEIYKYDYNIDIIKWKAKTNHTITFRFFISLKTKSKQLQNQITKRDKIDTPDMQMYCRSLSWHGLESGGVNLVLMNELIPFHNNRYNPTRVISTCLIVDYRHHSVKFILSSKLRFSSLRYRWPWLNLTIPPLGIDDLDWIWLYLP